MGLNTSANYHVFCPWLNRKGPNSQLSLVIGAGNPGWWNLPQNSTRMLHIDWKQLLGNYGTYFWHPGHAARSRGPDLQRLGLSLCQPNSGNPESLQGKKKNLVNSKFQPTSQVQQLERRVANGWMDADPLKRKKFVRKNMQKLVFPVVSCPIISRARWVVVMATWGLGFLADA